MADLLRSGRRRGHVRGHVVAQRAYALQPVRSRAVRVGVWVLVCVACMAAGAAAMRGHVRADVSADPPCVAPAAHDALQDALARAQLALKQEAASRASVQRSADALTVEVRRLQAQVLFLQGQSRSHR
ncbi:hypothetical protein [Paraburkholderia sp. 22B1P]|uniref:hypothetical protein n=1 Tax=Paraburkholderia sp. 22B1P TaxID=3080498 RepID=UPI0020896DC0|nr:hypothetical protein PBP221_40440 [Paraburkholderia sp. 22B1P]GJH38363.1 hypothetical protein CBA19CS91_36420 [Paraburkholderia hospita]